MPHSLHNILHNSFVFLIIQCLAFTGSTGTGLFVLSSLSWLSFLTSSATILTPTNTHTVHIPTTCLNQNVKLIDKSLILLNTVLNISPLVDFFIRLLHKCYPTIPTQTLLSLFFPKYQHSNHYPFLPNHSSS